MEPVPPPSPPPSPSPRLAKLQEMVRANPKNLLALFGIAMEYRALGERTMALAAFEHVLAIDPAHVATHQQMGYLLVELGRCQDARAIFQKGIQHAVTARNERAQREMSEALAKLDAPAA